MNGLTDLREGKGKKSLFFRDKNGERKTFRQHNQFQMKKGRRRKEERRKKERITLCG